VTIGATTAEKLEGTARGVDADPLPFLRPSLPRLPFLLHPCYTHSLPYSSFLLLLSLARRSGLLPTLPSEKNGSQLQSWRELNTLSPHYLQSWRGRFLRVS